MSTEKPDPTPAELLQIALDAAPESLRLSLAPEPDVRLWSQDAAAYLGISPPSIWRWPNTKAGFPQPQKCMVAGRPRTFWWKSELDAWMAKQDDLAWRHGKPGALHSAEIIDMGQRALDCAHLLGLSPFEIWGGLSPDPSPEGTEAMWHFVADLVNQLLRDAPEEKFTLRGYPADMELSGYLRTLNHCKRVMDGLEPPEIRGPLGFTNPGGYRIGRYPGGK